MSWLAKLTLCSLLLAVLGIVLEIIFLPIGACGNGGWSTAPVLIGIVSIPVFFVSIICLIGKKFIRVR
jgi:hypothetical protein